MEIYERHQLEENPAVRYVSQWCLKNLPVADRLSVVHGDYRRGNFLFDDNGITAVLDWEQAHLGDGLEDIAFAHWPVWTAATGISLADILLEYERCSGRPVDRPSLAYYRMFIELKMSIVLITALNGFFATEERQLRYVMAPDTMLSEAMLRCMDELLPGSPSFEWSSADASASAL